MGVGISKVRQEWVRYTYKLAWTDGDTRDVDRMNVGVAEVCVLT